MDQLMADQARTLRLGTSLLRPAHTWALLMTALGLPLTLAVVVIYTVAAAAEGPICPAIWTVTWNALVENPANLAMLGLVTASLPVGLAFFIMERRARIRITPAGLEADIPRWLGLGILRQTAGQWSVRWDEVRRVRSVCAQNALNAAQRLASYRLVIETKHGETRVAAFRWYDPGARDHRLRLGELFGMRKQAAARLESAPLVRAINARGLSIETDSEASAPGFDLTQHKGIMAQVSLLFGAGLYALAETFFIQPYLALGPLPVLPFGVAGAVSAFAVWKLGQGAPIVERAAIGVITVAACVAATHPAMLRLNAATAAGEMLTYVSLGEGRFESVDRFPAIDLSGLDVAEYWTQYPPGERHEFTLLKGSGGFYQIELAPIYERTRRFYRDRDT